MPATRRGRGVAGEIAVNLVLTDETLLGGANTPAEICDYGPIPAAVARNMVAGAVADRRSRAARRPLPHAVLRRAHPAPRPCAAPDQLRKLATAAASSGDADDARLR